MFGPMRSIGDRMNIETETLTDKSKVYNLIVDLDHDDPYSRRVKIGCADKESAMALARALEDVSFIELVG